MEQPHVLRMCSIAAVLLLASRAAAADESKPCVAEPTDQPIAYGDVLSGANCALGSSGDLDTFRFVGSKDEIIRVVAVDPSGLNGASVCVELFSAGGPRIGSKVCNDAGVFQFDAKLIDTGTQTIVVSEANQFYAIPYSIGLERLLPKRTEWPAIDFGSTVSDEINPGADLDVFRFPGTQSDVVRFVATDLHALNANHVCVEVLKPDNTPLVQRTCGDISVEFDRTLPETGIYSVIVTVSYNPAPYSLTLTCLAGACGPKLPVCDAALDYSSGNLGMNFTLRTVEPATWTIWFSFFNRTIPLWSIPLPVTDPPLSLPLPIPNFPKLGIIGVLSTFATAKGMICSDWSTVDTGTPTAGAQLPTEEQLRRLIQLRH